MTRIHNVPDDFVDEMIEGFVAANADRVMQVRGGVVRSTKVTEGEVALVIGGGSGHYPTFCGFVGPGLAHGAAMGNLFASPSAQQIYSVAKNAHHDGGVIFSFGNYAGDTLHFGHAAEELQKEGIDCRIVKVTDDVYSASISEKSKRRGIAGDFTVFKVAGASAARGDSLDEVTRLAEKANEHTRSIGVAFSGCYLPGADEPLFDVPKGRMEVGMGIHGEPGINEIDTPTADELAALMVEAVLAKQEWPAGISTEKGARIVVMLNGLGSVKYEELFVVYRKVNMLLKERGIVIVEPEVGELVTSFDMAGVSLTVFWLDDELEALWSAPASAPGYKKGSGIESERLTADEMARNNESSAALNPGSLPSQQLAAFILAKLRILAETINLNAELLGKIDAVAGDGDHGIGMNRGIQAAVRAAELALDKGAGAGSLLQIAGDAWSDRAGGTSGALWGAALSSAGARIGDEAAPDLNTMISTVRDSTDAILKFGAQVGDKTMVDALVPFSKVFSESKDHGGTLSDIWLAASSAATEAALGTASLLPKVGRARPHAEKSLGTPDAGAVSFAILVEAATSDEPLRSHPFN
ncbi:MULTISPECIES: dihydroxyacetone kinase family protein [unclassified Pantoea]|uniref:dihydroxyacetone kinase family protein n=1 Tax=unclassified Pantoea TaxID=2630326 RepID=UPI001CD5EAF6|nr:MULTISPECIES: dihydroxyacetone kinase family protein [unclassified Pantoea]MCA1179478.1 dihydroxyacetone kinase family protein [Pantoea sp. alder69]MCA1251731.1 dihydroxyacetone kinase family protein [Pantoea sp. alder70]MCA1267932.1 dihydroxyacetone kinase family protein [Pantoea sp. alder81]